MEAGELALNTNGTNPGLFFEANDGSIVKVGPASSTSDGNPPLLSNSTSDYNEGELWFDSSIGSGTLKIYIDGAWVQAWNGASDGVTPGCVVGDVIPCSSSQYDLGLDSQKWSRAFVDNVYSEYVYSEMLRTKNLYPTAPFECNIGSVGQEWTRVYADTVYVDTVEAQTLTASTVNTDSVYAENVYTGDLHMKNDRGDWTAIEEEDFLSLRNNKTGKRYKIMMEEIPEG